jgi:hypothetical protein
MTLTYHEDYHQPLVVQWLCVRCHQRVHPKLRREEP